MSVIIAVRVPKWLRDEAKKYGINISKVVREALEKEIEAKRISLLKKLQKEAREIISKLDPDEIVSAVREVRNER